ncbi:MAG: hypothetical protein VX597_00180 [Pseudomonadota bacterium]|nr:hypothetical protein [Pseudomonadota bacterium]
MTKKLQHRNAGAYGLGVIFVKTKDELSSVTAELGLNCENLVKNPSSQEAGVYRGPYDVGDIGAYH